MLAAAAVAVVAGVPPPARLRLRQLRDLQRPAPARALALPRRTLVVPGAAAAALLLSGPVAALVAGAGAAVTIRWLQVRAAAAGRTEERARMAEACAVLAAELEAGRSPADALAAAAPAASGGSRAALTAAAAAARMGGHVPHALTGTPTSTAVPHVLRALAACWTACAASGSGLAAAVARLADAVRDDLEQQRAVDAELAGPRATASLLAGLPIAGVLLAAALGADPLHVLLHTPLGAACLLLGSLLDLLGVAWTRRIVARAGGG